MKNFVRVTAGVLILWTAGAGASCGTKPAALVPVSSAVSSAAPASSAAPSSDPVSSAPPISSAAPLPPSSSAPPPKPPEDPVGLLPAVHIGAVAANNINRDAYAACTVRVAADPAGNFPSAGEMRGQIRGRGNSTWEWPKKPYKIKLDGKASLLGLDAAKEWVLLANYADKSMLRNIAAFAVSGYLGTFLYTPAAIPVDLYVGGQYRGIYTLGEQLEVKQSRIPLDEDYEQPDTGYLLECGGKDDGDVFGRDYFHSKEKLANFLRIKSPDAEKMSAGHFAFIRDYVNSAEQAIIAKTGYEDWIDVDSFVDWFLLHELAYNLDSCFRRSCYITKPAGGKLQMGPVWDFDLAFGNFSKDNQAYDDWATCGEDKEEAYIKVTWYNHLLEDPSFREKARLRWNAAGKGMKDAAFAAIDANARLIRSRQAKNFRLWDILNKRAGYQSWKAAQYKTYDAQVEYLKNFITKRAQWIDKNL